MTPSIFVQNLRQVQFEDAFNPYRDRCSKFDMEDAPRRRSDMLEELIEAAQNAEVDAIWVGRDLGHRGGRRTGLALTDDIHFGDHLSRWKVKCERPTTGRLVPERTAGTIWQILNRIDTPVFLWNVYPLHPFVKGDPFSNRSHNASERRAGISLLKDLISLVRPKRLIAVGNDAERAIHEVSDEIPTLKVRHPSYGGQADFVSGICGAYRLSKGSLL